MNETPQKNYNFSKEEMKMPKKQYREDEEMNGSHLVILLGVAILLLLLVLAGLYLWDTTLQTNQPTDSTPTRPSATENQEPESTNARADVSTLEAMSTSDETGAILADLENTKLDRLTPELNTINRTLTNTQ